MPQPLAGIRGNAVSAAGIVIENAEIEVFIAGSADLKPDLFEGVRFDFAKPLNAKFSLSHR